MQQDQNQFKIKIDHEFDIREEDEAKLIKGEEFNMRKMLFTKKYGKQIIVGHNDQLIRRKKHKVNKKSQKLCCARPHDELLSNNWQKIPRCAHYISVGCGLGNGARPYFIQRLSKKIDGIHSIKEQMKYI